MSDLAWVIAETRGMCRRKQRVIAAKESSPCKGLDTGGYGAFEDLEMQYARIQNTRRQTMRQSLEHWWEAEGIGPCDFELCP